MSPRRLAASHSRRQLNLTVPTGSVYGFIGPNGSGKTTTLRMIMRILHPDRGEIEVLASKVGMRQPTGLVICPRNVACTNK